MAADASMTATSSRSRPLASMPPPRRRRRIRRSRRLRPAIMSRRSPVPRAIRTSRPGSTTTSPSSMERFSASSARAALSHPVLPLRRPSCSPAFSTGDHSRHDRGLCGRCQRPAGLDDQRAASVADGASCSPCVILGLTPSLLAQFTTRVPWLRTRPETFPNSGALSSFEYSAPFSFSLSAAGKTTVSWSGATLLDTGTPTCP